MDNKHGILPQLMQGYRLAEGEEWFSVIVPEASTNLFKDPSFENSTNPLLEATASNSAISRVTTDARRGIYCLKSIPVVNIDGGFYLTATGLTTQAVHTFSFDIKAVAGTTIKVFNSPSGVSNYYDPPRAFVATGSWQRVSFTWLIHDATTNFYIMRQARNATLPFYVDGVQLERKDYATTYIDGDQKGSLVNQKAFSWASTPHASSSSRISETGVGGREINFDAFGFQTMGVVGLELPRFNILATNLSNGGFFYQKSLYADRQFTLVGRMSGQTRFELEGYRKSFEAALNPYRTLVGQEIIIRYHLTDKYGNDSKTLDIPCIYESGLEGNVGDLYQDNVGLVFHQAQPFLYEDGNKAQVFDAIYDSVSNVNGIICQDSTGDWVSMYASSDITEIRCILGGPNDLYVGGNFGTINGITMNNIARWNGSAWSALGTGLNGWALGMALAQDGTTLYVVGTFTTAGGVTCGGIAKWDGSAWSALTTVGVAGGAAWVYSVAIGINGEVYIGGNFTTVNGITCNNVAVWNGVTWKALGTTGVNAEVRSMVVDASGALYLGGNFTIAGALFANHIAKWDGTSWSQLADGSLTPGLNLPVQSLAFDKTGDLIIGGVFTSTSFGLSLAAIARWNGNSYSPIGQGVTGLSAAPKGVEGVGVSPDGTIYICGTFDNVDGSNVTDSIAYFNGNRWVGLDVDLVGHCYGWCCGFWNGNTYFGYRDIPTGLAKKPHRISVSNSGDMTYPLFYVVGASKLSIINNSVQKSYFNTQLYVIDKEKAEIDFTDQSMSIISKGNRGNLSSNIRPGSVPIPLKPGVNTIGIMMIPAIIVTGDKNQLKGYDLITGITASNSNNYHLYFSIIFDSGILYHVDIFKDFARTQKVGHTNSVALNTNLMTITADGASGIGGYIYGYMNDGTPVSSTIEAYFPPSTNASASLQWRERHFGLSGGAR